MNPNIMQPEATLAWNQQVQWMRSEKTIQTIIKVQAIWNFNCTASDIITTIFSFTTTVIYKPNMLMLKQRI